MKKNIQESFVDKTSKKRATDIVPKKLELDEQSFFSLIYEYTDSLGIKNFNKGDIVDTKSESGRERPVIVQKEVKRYYKPETASVGSFAVSLVVSPYSYFWGKATEIPVFDLDFKVLFYPNNNEIRIGIYVNNYKAKCCRKNGVSYEVVPRHFFRKSDGRFLDKGFDFFYKPKKFLELTKMGIDTDTLEICKNYIKHIADFKIEPEKGTDVLNLSNESLEDAVTKVQSVFGSELFHLEENVFESFTKKISSKKNTDLAPDLDYPDGVYILHETLGVRGVDGWNPKDNEGVVGILLIEDDHKIVVALEDSPNVLHWSEEYKLVNRPIKNSEDAKSDFNGEEYCRNLNSSDFPAAYYCSNYKKGGRNWYLSSPGELYMILRHLEEVQTALLIVGGEKFLTTSYWGSTEGSASAAWYLQVTDEYLCYCANKVINSFKVRPISKFQPSKLKESFTKKISSKKNSDLISKPSFVPDDGVYILHETLGVRGVDGWNPKDNEGVVGILLIEDDHKIVVALEDSPKKLLWSDEFKLVNQSIKNEEDAEFDFNGEKYCKNLNSSKYPAAYYCLNYNKGGRNWYLPSSGELYMILIHLEEIQTALSIVGGQKFVDEWDDNEDNVPCYWSSTEYSVEESWYLHLGVGNIDSVWGNKVGISLLARPISKFQPSELKESFAKKIKTKGRKGIIDQADNLVIDYDKEIKSIIKKYGFSTIGKNILMLCKSRVGNEDFTPYVRTHEPFTEDKMVIILGELELDKSETDDNEIRVVWRKTKKFHYRCPIEETEKFSELPVEEKRDIYKYLLKWLKRKN